MRYKTTRLFEAESLSDLYEIGKAHGDGMSSHPEIWHPGESLYEMAALTNRLPHEVKAMSGVEFAEFRSYLRGRERGGQLRGMGF